VASIRAAATTRLDQGGATTQTTGGDNSPNGGLIVATINYGGATLTLFISPMDLYLRGIANTEGQVFIFNDFDIGSTTYTTVAEIVGNGAIGYTNAAQSGALAAQRLNLESNYNSMTNANGGRGRESLTMSYSNFTDAFFNLAYLNMNGRNDTQNDLPHVARSLMFMIQMTSEAARFNDVMGTARAIMYGPTYDGYGNQLFSGTQQGLPVFQQYLENNWARISSYGWDNLNNPNYTETIQGINPDTGNYTTYGNGDPYTLSSYVDVANFLAVLLTNGEVNDPGIGGFWGDWNKDEL
jgi:hypothetical protein